MSINYVFDDNGIYIRNLANNAEQLGIGQYRFPHNYELVGKTFVITAGEEEHTITFNCRKGAELDGVKCGYECEKLNKDLYFVQLGLDSAVLDIENGQSALIIDDRLICGVIKGIGEKAPAFAGDDMVETKVRWIFGCGRYVNQEFISADAVRTAWAPRDEKTADNAYKAVKFRDTFYLVIAESGDLKNVCAPFFTRRVILLEDYERCMTVGCVKGDGFDPIVVSGYAKFID